MSLNSLKPQQRDHNFYSSHHSEPKGRIEFWRWQSLARSHHVTDSGYNCMGTRHIYSVQLIFITMNFITLKEAKWALPAASEQSKRSGLPLVDHRLCRERRWIIQAQVLKCWLIRFHLVFRFFVYFFFLFLLDVVWLQGSLRRTVRGHEMFHRKPGKRWEPAL